MYPLCISAPLACRSTVSMAGTSAVAPAVLSARAFARSSPALAGGDDPAPSFVQSLLHGSRSAKEEVRTQQHSRLVGRGKYVHELIKHRIVPGNAAEYREAAAKHFGAMMSGRGGATAQGGDLMGSWEVVVGELDTFIHVVRHPSLSQLNQTILAPGPSPTLAPLLPHLITRETCLLQEFAALPAHDNPAMSTAESTEEGLFELRTYELVPGSMLEWEGAWRKGIEARKRYVSPAGAWFTQAGPLHTVNMLWRYKDLEARKEIRSRAWEVSGWSDTVKETVKLTRGMSSQMLKPCEWSPLK